MANVFITPADVTREALPRLANNLVMAGLVERTFEKSLTGKKIGDTISVRKPVKFQTVQGPALQVQDIGETSVNLTITNQAHVDMEWDMSMQTLAIEEVAERFIGPAMETLANSIDLSLTGLFSSVYNEVGVPGVPAATFAAANAVAQRMDDEGVPQRDRHLVMSSTGYNSLLPAFIGSYVKDVAMPAYKGIVPTVTGFAGIYMDQNVQAQTTGLLGGTPLVFSAGQTGSSIVTNGWTPSITGLLNKGDVITFAGVYAVNPVSLQRRTALRNFVVTATVNSDSSGNCIIPVYPPITLAGAGAIANPYTTCSASPANGAAVVVLSGTTGQYTEKNIAFHRSAFGFACVPLDLPPQTEASQMDYLGLSIRALQAYDIRTDRNVLRLDILYGSTCFYPEMACRLTN